MGRILGETPENGNDSRGKIGMNYNSATIRYTLFVPGAGGGHISTRYDKETGGPSYTCGRDFEGVGSRSLAPEHSF